MVVGAFGAYRQDRTTATSVPFSVGVMVVLVHAFPYHPGGDSRICAPNL